MNFVASDTSAWLIVAVTAERLGIVSLPHKAKSLFTRKRSYIVISSIAMFFIIFNTRIIFTFGIFKIALTNNGNITDGLINHEMSICSPDKNQYLFPTTVWMWFDLAWYNIIPFVVILLCNIGIIVIVTRATTARRHMATQGMYRSMPSYTQLNIPMLSTSLQNV